MTKPNATKTETKTERIFEDETIGYWCKSCGSTAMTARSVGPAVAICECCGADVEGSIGRLAWFKTTAETTFGPYRSRDGAVRGGNENVRD